MKNIFAAFVMTLTSILVYSQTEYGEGEKDLTLLKTDSLIPYHSLSKKTAEEILTKAWTYLKTYDQKSFTDLWMLDSSSPPKHEGRAFTTADILKNFNMIRQYLDTARNQNLKIDHIDIDRENLQGTDSEYWIKAWFKYNEHYYKGFGFYIANKHGKWVVRDNPSTSAKEKLGKYDGVYLKQK